jgi:hypothetical protein
VIGLLHADRYFQGRDTDLVDRETLASFAHGLRLALSARPSPSSCSR